MYVFESSVDADLFYNNTKRCFIYYFWRRSIFIRLIMDKF